MIRFTVLFLFPLLVSAQQSIYWQKSFGGAEDDKGRCIIACDDGNFIIAGQAMSEDGDFVTSFGGNDMWVLKIDSGGNVIWKKNYGSLASESAQCITKALSNGYVIAGEAHLNGGHVTGSHGSTDFWVVRVDSLGNLIWARCFGSPDSDFAYDVIPTKDSGFVICGEINFYGGNVQTWHGMSDLWVIKINKFGNLIWQKTFGGLGPDEAKSVIELSDESLIIGGTVDASMDTFPGAHAASEFAIYKLNKYGQLLWEKYYGGSGNDNLVKVMNSTANGFCAFGSAGSNDGDVQGFHGVSDIWMLECDSNGSIITSTCFGDTMMRQLLACNSTSDKGFVFAYRSFFCKGNSDYFISRIDSNRNELWASCFGGTQDDDPGAIIECAPSEYIVTGESFSSDSDVIFNHSPFHSDMWTIKIGSNSSTSINDFSIDDFEFSISNNELSILNKSISNKIKQIRIYDVSGKISFLSMVDEYQYRSDFALSLTDGIYILQVVCDKGIVSKKFFLY